MSARKGSRGCAEYLPQVIACTCVVESAVQPGRSGASFSCARARRAWTNIAMVHPPVDSASFCSLGLRGVHHQQCSSEQELKHGHCGRAPTPRRVDACTRSPPIRVPDAAASSSRGSPSTVVFDFVSIIRMVVYSMSRAYMHDTGTSGAVHTLSCLMAQKICYR